MGAQRSFSCNARRNQAKSTRHPVTNLLIRAAPPSPQSVAAWKRLGSRFSQYFAVFFWAFSRLSQYPPAAAAAAAPSCSSFFGVQLVRHERADSPSKDINSYGCRKGAEQSREGREARGAARPFAGCRQSSARVGRASSCGKWHVASR